MLLLDLDLILPIASGTVLLTVLLSFIVYFILLYRKRQEEYEWEKEQAKQLLLKTEIEITNEKQPIDMPKTATQPVVLPTILCLVFKNLLAIK